MVASLCQCNSRTVTHSNVHAVTDHKHDDGGRGMQCHWICQSSFSDVLRIEYNIHISIGCAIFAWCSRYPTIYPCDSFIAWTLQATHSYLPSNFGRLSLSSTDNNVFSRNFPAFRHIPQELTVVCVCEFCGIETVAGGLPPSPPVHTEYYMYTSSHDPQICAVCTISPWMNSMNDLCSFVYPRAWLCKMP